MKKYKQAAASIALLTIMLSAGLSSNYTSDQNDGQNRKNTAKQEAILSAFENRDYESWQNILAKNNKSYPALTEADFNEFIAARQAARAGNYNKALEISRRLTASLSGKLV